MTPRQTNLALLWLTLLSFVTGALAFTVGTPLGLWVVVGHGLGGLALLVLIPWKTPIVSRGMRRRRYGRVMSILLTVVVSLTVATGVIQVTGLTHRLGPFTVMQVHVGAGVVALVLIFWHLVQRPTGRPTDRDKRVLIRSLGVLGGAGLVYLGSEALWGVSGVPGGERRFTGSHLIDDIADVPATQWLNDRVRHLESDHTFTLMGAPLAVADLGRDHLVTATLDCTGGWYTTQTWEGIRLDRLIDTTPGQSLVVRSVTGYWRRFPIEQAADLLLATHVAGDPLRDGHGGPVRLVAPGRRGYWWVKWVSSIEVDDLPPWWQPPLPLA